MKAHENELISETTVESEPGFSKRLNSILKSLNMKKHGQFQKLSEWAGLSNSGARNFFIQDRPPKRENFTSLIEGITKEAWDKRSIKLSKKDIEKYLLEGGKNPFGKFPNPEEERGNIRITHNGNQTLHSLAYSIIETDPKDVSSILDIISMVAIENDIEFVNDIDADQRTQLLLKCMELFVVRGVAIKSSKMRSLVSTLMEAASEKLL